MQGPETDSRRTDRQPEPAPRASEAAATVGSAELLRGRQELRIEHAGEVYRLRLTGKGKLILTK